MAVVKAALDAPSRSTAWPLELRWHLPAWLMRDVLLPFLITRAALAIVGLLTVAFLPRVENWASAWLSSHPWLSIWSVWDTRWYLSIARDGYSYLPGQQSNAAFAPGLPLLMRIGGLLSGRADDDVYLLAGFVATNLALLVALGYLVALVRLDFDQATASRTAVYLLIFPSSLFLSAVYPHSLFLACAIASFYYARQGRWWLAGILGCGAGVTRLQASALALPLAYEYLRQQRFDLRRVRLNVLALACVPVCLLAFGLYLYAATGDPLAALNAGRAWHRQLTPPWEVLGPFLSDPLGNHGVQGTSADFGFTVLLLALAALSWRRLPASLALFATTFALVIVSSGILVSSMRYTLEVFPLFITLALLGRRPMFHRAYIAVACLNGLKLMSLFAQGAWIA